MVLGLLDESQEIEGATTDAEKLTRIWNKMGLAGVECQHRRLGAETGGRRKRSLLFTIRDKDTRSQILVSAKKLRMPERELHQDLCQEGRAPRSEERKEAATRC